VQNAQVEFLQPPIGRRRWLICALLFFATTINYADRQVLGLLAPLLQVRIGWDEKQYAYIGTAFLIAYAIGLPLMGWFIDRVGTRTGYATAIAIWSVAAMAHSLVRSALGFGIVRFALGLGESGNFPAAIKTVAEWFPKKERALATGIFNSGTNAGATIAPLTVPWIALRFGWQFAFLFTGAFSAVWILCWLTLYQKPQQDARLSPAELTYILSDPAETGAPRTWASLLVHRQTWAFLLGKFLTDPIWWFFLFWLPKFFSTVHGVSLMRLGLPLVIIYNCATVGSVLGGWLPARFLKAGWSVNRARKTAMLICAMVVVPVVLAAKIHSLWGAILVISMAAAAHQGWSANLFTLVSDLFPKNAVASVVGIGSFGGAIGGALIATFTGFLLQLTHSYVPIFFIAGFIYLVALLVIHSLTPRLEPIAGI
jgi:ACS family hexuronate transporter-like MFS transporter